MQLQNNLYFKKKLKIVLLSALFTSLFISNITLTSADDIGDSSVYFVGNNSGFVLADSNTDMYFYAENASDLSPMSGATINIRVTGIGDLGAFQVGLTEYPITTGFNMSIPATTDINGELEFIWETPTVSDDTVVTFAATAIHESEKLYLGEQSITITNDAVDLDSFIIVTDNEAYNNETIIINATLFSLDGGDLDNLEIEFLNNYIIPEDCNFSSEFVDTDDQGKASTTLSLPGVSNTVAVLINATTRLNNGLIFRASTIVNVHPYDFNNSRIEAVTDVTADDTILVTIVSEGTYGIIANSTVTNFQSIAGEFNVSTIQTDEKGEAVIEWTADVTTEEIDTALNATINKGEAPAKTISFSITIHPIYYTIHFITNVTTLDVNQTLEIQIAILYKSSPIENAIVIVDTLGFGGYFIGTDNEEIDGLSNASGIFICYWVADLVSMPGIGSDIVFTVQTYDGLSALSTTDFTIRINPMDVGFTTTFEANETYIYYTHPVNFSLELLLKDVGYEGAIVTISALVGIFEGSENSQKQRITDVDGIAEFTWYPTGLGNPDSPQVLNFTLEISIAEHNLILYDWVTVTVVPEGYDLDDGTPPTTDPSGTDDSDDSGIDDQTIIIGAGAVLITIVIGGTIVLIRRN